MSKTATTVLGTQKPQMHLLALQLHPPMEGQLASWTWGEGGTPGVLSGSSQAQPCNALV